MSNQKKEDIVKYLEGKIRNIPDFPKPGVQFKDITTILADKKALKTATQALAEPFKEQNIDVVAGLESRGFIFGTCIANILGASFVPVRKPGKLPAEVISEEYELEYGTGSLEIHVDAITPGSRVLIHDDLIATGGTAAAAGRLVERLGGNLVSYSFLIELSYLNGRELLKNTPVESLLIL